MVFARFYFFGVFLYFLGRFFGSLTADTGNDIFNILPLVFPILHVAVGFGLTYYTLCGFLNRTYILADRHEVSISHKPLWFMGQKVILRADIQQLYVAEKRSTNKNGAVSYSYKVMVLDRQNRASELVTLDDREQASFIETKIESYLGIPHQEVKGAVS
jgi:hypothetical protein